MYAPSIKHPNNSDTREVWHRANPHDALHALCNWNCVLDIARSSGEPGGYFCGVCKNRETRYAKPQQS